MDQKVIISFLVIIKKYQNYMMKFIQLKLNLVTGMRFILNNIIPNIFNETQDLYIPQSVNLDLIGAVNFKKGCYTGQEVVARTHYLGKPKRRMYLGSVTLNKNPELGSDIKVDDEKVGSLVNSYKQENNIFKVLVELRIEKIDARPTLDGNEILSLEMQY